LTWKPGSVLNRNQCLLRIKKERCCDSQIHRSPYQVPLSFCSAALVSICWACLLVYRLLNLDGYFSPILSEGLPYRLPHKRTPGHESCQDSPTLETPFRLAKSKNKSTPGPPEPPFATYSDQSQTPDNFDRADEGVLEYEPLVLTCACTCYMVRVDIVLCSSLRRPTIAVACWTRYHSPNTCSCKLEV
jgi:hypothetical protein